MTEYPPSRPEGQGYPGDRTDPAKVGRSGSMFLVCSDGRTRWGIFGAAGVLFVHHGGDGRTRVQLQKRSLLSHEGGSWSCAGGALDEGEDALVGALREASEEVGEVPEPITLLGTYLFEPATDWTYTTAVAEVPERFGSSLNFETDAVEWFEPEQVEAVPLHSGFAAAWPHLRRIIDWSQTQAPEASDD